MTELKEEVISAAKRKLITKAKALQRLLSDDKHAKKREGQSGLRRILRVDSELHKIFSICSYPIDLALNDFMAQEIEFKDYDKKIMAIKDDLDVFNLLSDSSSDNSKQPPKKRRKKNIKRSKPIKNIVNLNMEQGYDTSESDDNTKNPFSNGYDGDAIKRKIEMKNRKRLEKTLAPVAKGSDFSVICLKQYISDSGVEFETRNAQIAELLKVTEYREDKFINWKQLDIYNDSLYPFLRKALMRFYYHNVGANEPIAYKQKVDQVKSNLIEQFDSIINVFKPEKINLALISIVNSSSVNLDNIIDKTSEQISLIKSDSRNRIDSQYIKNATIN
eukprot:216326_1